MENSPPGIHTIPSGRERGAGSLLRMVGAKATLAGAPRLSSDPDEAPAGTSAKTANMPIRQKVQTSIRLPISAIIVLVFTFSSSRTFSPWARNFLAMFTPNVRASYHLVFLVELELFTGKRRRQVAPPLDLSETFLYEQGLYCGCREFLRALLQCGHDLRMLCCDVVL